MATISEKHQEARKGKGQLGRDLATELEVLAEKVGVNMSEVREEARNRRRPPKVPPGQQKNA